GLRRPISTRQSQRRSSSSRASSRTPKSAALRRSRASPRASRRSVCATRNRPSTSRLSFAGCARTSRRSRTLTDAPRVLRIGVRFALTSDAGELFADARAVESAGADSLWFDAADGDPYVALAALAAVTWRARLVAKGAPRGAG